MEKESLYIFKLDAQGSKIKFPNADTPAKLGEYTYTAQRMAGTPTLTATLNHPMCLDDLWSGEEFVEFRGEKYYVDQTPTSSKDNKSVLYKHELQFVSERIVLENVYFMDVVTAGADTYHSNSTSVKFMGDINEFVGRLNASMTKSGIDYSVVIDDDIASDSKLVSLDNVYLAEALQSIYTIYELPYYFVGKVCHIGYTENVISTPFEYRKGLVSIKKTNANYKIVNRVTGVGSSDNIPFYYPNDDETGNIDQCQNLMPSIYRESGGAERYYNALDNTYKIPGTDDYYSFKNQYSPHKVKEFKVDFSDIKPTIEGVTNASGQLFGEIADIAFDENDSDELGTGEGNNVFNGTDEYVHSYFYIKLHIYNGDYGFNLFEQGLEGGTAVINMTTGNCAACAFEIGVTYKDSEPQRAFNPVLVDSSGNLPAGDFEQKVTSQTSQYVERQQNTSTNSVWIAVKKDNTTFGVVMPNATNNYKPSIGDKFVITGIKMPKSLVLAAEKRLDEALIKYMSENNDEKFTFSVNFSRVFLADNIYLWDMLNENARIYIKYNNREYLMYVNSFTCKADKNCLYDISVELTDKLSANVSALRSTITEIAGDIIGNIQGGGYGGDILAKTSKHYIRKDQPDSAKYLVKFLKGIHTGLYTPEESGGMIDEEGNAELKKMSLRSGLDSNGPVTTDEVVSKNFTSGLLGVGHRLWNGVLEISELIVRKTMHVFEIIVQKVTSVNGSMLTTPGGGVRISEVEELEDGYKCLFNNDDGTIPNPFIVGDQALHQVFTGKNIGRYWRLVTEVGDNYFVLSKTDCEPGSGIPQVEDEIIQFGNRTDKNRQNAVLTTSYGSDAPYTAYYSNVNSYSLEGKEDVREGNLRGINDPDFGQLQGSGFYGKNVYLKGIFRLLSGKTVEESIGDVQSNLDNLQVGETNLLDNSNKGWKNSYYLTATIYLGDYKPKEGEECTIVIKGKLGTDKTYFRIFNSGGSVVLTGLFRNMFNADNIATRTFKWKLEQSSAVADNKFINIYAYESSVVAESEIEWVKLVLGNKTSLLWTPSINDQRQIAIDEAGKAVDGIQIGGVNILKGSTTGILWDFSTHNGTEFSRTGTSTAENSYIYSDYIILKGDTEIVLSFYAKHVGVLNSFDLYILPDDFNTYGLIGKGYQSGEDWVYNVLKLKTPSKWGDGKRVRLRIDHNGSPDGSSATIYVKDVQIEYGNKATTYSVPESDRQAEIKTITKTLTEIKAENGEISLRVNEVSERVEEAKQEAIDAAKEYTTLKTYRETEIDLRAEKWDQDTYYPVTIRIPTYETMIEVTAMWGASKPEWATHENGYFSMNCVWRSNGSGWGAFTVKRTIEVFEYRFTKEIPDTTPVQYILPAGSIGQLISNSEELIYLRGGGRYLFKIGNNCVAVVHDSRYTAPDGTAVAPVTSVIRPVLTNVMKTEFDSQITQLKNSINLRVTKTDYNNDQQIVNKDISDLQINYNQISSTVSKIINGTQEISGVVTQSNFVTIFSSNKNALGQEVIESINVGGGGVTIDASRINLNGAISANGNVQITTDGKLIAVNGQFTGKITATEGEIAGLKLSNNGLRSSDFNASSKIGSCYAKNGFSVYASGAGVLTPSIGGMQAGIITAVGDFISHITGLEIIAKETSYNYGSSSKVTALRIQAENRYYGTPFDPPLAIEVVSGDVLFGSKMTVNNTSIFRGQIYLNLNNIPNISGASNYYLCINRSTGQLSYR